MQSMFEQKIELKDKIMAKLILQQQLKYALHNIEEALEHEVRNNDYNISHGKNACIAACDRHIGAARKQMKALLEIEKE